MEFHENLAKLRKKANLSQEQLADKLNVTRQAISKWESGQTKPETDKVLMLSEIFGVTTDELLKGTQNPKKEKSEKTDFFPLAGYIFLILMAIGGYVGGVFMQMNGFLAMFLMAVPAVIFASVAVQRIIKKAINNKRNKR